MNEHMDDLLRHIRMVQNNCQLLASKLNDAGFARILIANSMIHDASKFHGIEWDFLHRKCEEHELDDLKLAIKQHQSTNPHHPEYWHDINKMPTIYIAEMVCDWFARSQEKGKDIKEWVETVAIDKFKISKRKEVYKQIKLFMELLLQDNFAKGLKP